MEIRSDCENGVMTVYLGGEIDHHSARTMREQIDEAVEKVRPGRLRLSFAGVSFMDSSGVGLVMGRYRLMTGLSGRLTLCDVPESLSRMMRLAGLDRLPVWDETEKKETIV